jgi:hypothetical protein
MMASEQSTSFTVSDNGQTQNSRRVQDAQMGEESQIGSSKAVMCSGENILKRAVFSLLGRNALLQEGDSGEDTRRVEL